MISLVIGVIAFVFVLGCLYLFQRINKKDGKYLESQSEEHERGQFSDKTFWKSN